MRHNSVSGVLGLAAAILLVPIAGAVPHEKVLYRFTGGTDGASADSRLVMDAAGHLYGTAQYGGDLNCSNGYPCSGCGVVFELITSASGEWHEKVLRAFQGGLDGAQPDGNLVFDSVGNIYGTTSDGGAGTDCYGQLGCGTIFELSPRTNGNWKETVLYSFRNPSDGAAPAGLTFDASGNLYGTASTAISSEIYELSPPRQKGGAWAKTILYNMPDNMRVNSGLVFDDVGNLYASWSGDCCGGVFELKNVNGTWERTDLYDFLGGGYGGQPEAGVILDSKGRVYGTGVYGGNDWGIAFELKRGSQWTETMIHNFCSLNNCADGAWPEALVFDPAGNLYGVTYY